MTTCPQCHRDDGRHTIHCPRGRCQRCKRSPATIGPTPDSAPVWCGPCWKAIRREREKAVADRLAWMDGEEEW
jgi:hypothetical protein